MSIEACGFSRHLPLAATAGSDGNLLVWDMSALAMRSRCQHPVVSETACPPLSMHPASPAAARQLPPPAGP